MLGFLLRRLASSLLLLFFVLTLLFVCLHLAPGDPTALMLGERVPAEQQERLRAVFGLDRSLPEQYVAWLAAISLRFDFGTSLFQGRPATEVLFETVPATLLLASAAMAINLGAGILLGLVSARRQDRPADHAIRVGSLLLYSLPTFWIGLMTILLFAELGGWLPAGGMRSVGADALSGPARLWDLVQHLALPALVLGLSSCGYTARLVRNSLLEVNREEFVRTARAKGLSETAALVRHALPNALVPVIQMTGTTFPILLNGSLVIEVVFGWPGMGQAVMAAIQLYDYPVVLAATAFSGVLVVAGNLVADLVHAAIDPRVRHA